MALYFLLGLTFLFTVRALAGWREGILLMIVLAAIQDPLRKLVPGTPSWLVLVTAPVFAAVVFGSVYSTRSWWREFAKPYPAIAEALLLFIVLSLPAAFLSATYGEGSWMLTLIGAFSYSVIFLAIIAGFHLSRSQADVRKVLAVYCLSHGLMLSGGLIEYLQWLPGWRVIGDDVFGFNWFRDVPGYRIDIISGFYRSGDVMGWHAVTVCTLSMVLAMAGKGAKRRYWLLLSAFAVASLLLCGRRKMVYILPAYGLALSWLYWQAGRSARIFALVGLLALPAASVWIVGDWLGTGSSPIRYYTETSGETLERFQDHGFSSLVHTYRQSGFFGAGLGVATPGSHNLNVERPRIWQESGTSRILVEFGVLGTVGFFLVMISLLLALWRVTVEQLQRRRPPDHHVAGIVALFLANVGSLTVSGQILADPFIAAFLGLLVGLALSYTRPQLSGISGAVTRQELSRRARWSASNARREFAR